MLAVASLATSTYAKAQQGLSELRISVLQSDLELRDKYGAPVNCNKRNIVGGACYTEYYSVCGHINRDQSRFHQDPAYQKCAKALWSLVRAKNWVAVYNLTEKGVKNPIYVKTSARPVPPPKSASLDHGSYSDIDDLSADDIEIMDVATAPVKPPPKKPPKQKYCVCMFDHAEVFGFCRDDGNLRATKALFGNEMYDENGNVKKGYGSGMYKTGYYPWISQCKMTTYR